MVKVIAPIVLISLALGLGAWSWHSSQPRAVMIDTAGREQPRAGALLVNGWLIENHGAANVKDAWRRFEPYLNEPISGWDGQRQRFRGGDLVYTPGNDPQWRVEIANSGWRLMLSMA
jgi:hypothetical protein